MGNNFLGLDVGDRRVGLAVASHEARLASPAGIIDRSKEDVWTALARLIDEHQPGIVVIGLPRGLDGQETGQTSVVREFAEEFKRRFSVPMHFQDEAGTSRQAEEELRSRGVGYTKGDIDALAATIILTDFLSANGEM